MNCPNCGIQNVDGAKFCASCGTELIAPQPSKTFCQNCGTENLSTSKFCCSCGNPLFVRKDLQHLQNNRELDSDEDFFENRERTGKISIFAGVLLMILGIIVNRPELGKIVQKDIFLIMISLVAICGIYPLLKTFVRQTKIRFFISMGLYVISVFVATMQGDKGVSACWFILSGFLFVNMVYAWYRIKNE